jgi:type I restriction enzyme M protein
MDENIITRTQQLIDKLKATCASYGLGNDGNEYKVITQVFQYKFLNDKFIKTVAAELNVPAGMSEYDAIIAMSKDEYEDLRHTLSAEVAWFNREQLIPTLHNKQNMAEFDILFDQTLEDIAAQNAGIFSVKTSADTTVLMFEKLSHFITDTGKRPDFCRAIINKLSQFSFADAFDRGYDYFSSIYEYLIKDYNSDSGGKYAEYFTPHSVGRVMAEILVDGQPKSVTCYDPTAGSGTLLMCLASRIGANRCTIYSQDISQKSSGLLRLNLILNGLANSLQNVVQGNTLTEPAFSAPNGGLKQFNFIVSNPPFKLDFSDFREKLTSKERANIYFAGVPVVPANKKESMAIYLCFLQHVLASLTNKGKAAIVLPSGFLTARQKIEKAIRQQLVEKKWLRGVVSMPPNIFGTTGTSVSVLFIDKENASSRTGAVLIDASKLGEDRTIDGKKRRVLTSADEQQIIDAFKKHEPVDGLAVVPSYQEIEEKDFSFSAGQYFDVKIEHIDITPEEFNQKISAFMAEFEELSAKSSELDVEIRKQMMCLRYE